MRRGGRHPAWPCIGAGRQLWLGRRFGHLMALGSQRRHGRDPVDPGFLDLAGPGAREPRFRDLGLPGDLRLTFTRTGKEHAYDLSLAPTVGFLVFTPPVAASLSRVVRTTVIDARPDGAGRHCQVEPFRPRWGATGSPSCGGSRAAPLRSRI